LLFTFSIKHVFVKGNTRIIKNIIFTKAVAALFTKIGCHYIIIREIRVMKTLAHETNTYNRKLSELVSAELKHRGFRWRVYST